MNLVCDIKLNNGNILNSVYFKKYTKPVYGMGTILDHVTDSIKCFNSNDEELKNIDLSFCTFLKIYDNDTKADYTQKFIDVIKMLDYVPEIPCIREVIKIQ